MLDAVRYLLLLLLFWSWADDVMVCALVPAASNIAAEDDEYLAAPISIKRTHSDRRPIPAHISAVADRLSGGLATRHSRTTDPIACCSGFLYAFLSLQC